MSLQPSSWTTLEATTCFRSHSDWKMKGVDCKDWIVSIKIVLVQQQQIMSLSNMTLQALTNLQHIAKTSCNAGLTEWLSKTTLIHILKSC